VAIMNMGGETTKLVLIFGSLMIGLLIFATLYKYYGEDLPRTYRNAQPFLGGTALT
jgi:hypothetical protein